LEVVLWNDKANLASNIQPRQIVRVQHGYVKKSKDGEIELHIGQRGSIQISPSNVIENNLPPFENFLKKISAIKNAHRKVNLQGMVQATRPISTFERRDGTQGKVLRLMLADETGQVPVVFWNDKAEAAAKAKEGNVIILTNAKPQESQDGRLELHVDDSAGVEVLTKPESLVNIKNLKEGTTVTFIEGLVATKPLLREITTRRGEKVRVASFELKNQTGKIWVSLWEKHAEAVKGLEAGTKVKLRNVYIRRGFGGQLEVTTRASTQVEVEHQTTP